MEDQAKYETISGLTRTIKKNVVCPYCNGNGIIKQRKYYGHTDGWINSNHKCGVCNGAKLLERTVTVNYKMI